MKQGEPASRCLLHIDIRLTCGIFATERLLPQTGKTTESDRQLRMPGLVRASSSFGRSFHFGHVASSKYIHPSIFPSIHACIHQMSIWVSLEMRYASQNANSTQEHDDTPFDLGVPDFHAKPSLHLSLHHMVLSP